MYFYQLSSPSTVCVTGWVAQMVMLRRNLEWIMFFGDQPLWKGAKGRTGQRVKSAGLLSRQNLSHPTRELRSENLWPPQPWWVTGWMTVRHCLATGKAALWPSGAALCSQGRQTLKEQTGGDLCWSHYLELDSRPFLEGPSGWCNVVTVIAC